jgi:hypothetical protein
MELVIIVVVKDGEVGNGLLADGDRDVLSGDQSPGEVTFMARSVSRISSNWSFIL